MKPDNEKAFKRAVSLYPRQVQKMGLIIDLNRHGEFSHFVQDAIDEKLERIFAQVKNSNNPEKLAS
jgi:hypothetical protein